MSKKKLQHDRLLHSQAHAIDAGSLIDLYEDEATPTDMAIFHLSEAVRLLAAGLSDEIDVEQYLDQRMGEHDEETCPDCGGKVVPVEGVKAEEAPKAN